MKHKTPVQKKRYKAAFVPFVVYLTPTEHKALLDVKQKTGCPMAETVRRAVKQYLEAPNAV